MSDVMIRHCPFCGAAPVFPDSVDVRGTFYECGCDVCCIPTISIQIIDCFEHPRCHVHESWSDERVQYDPKYIEVARQEAICRWNKRV